MPHKSVACVALFGDCGRDSDRDRAARKLVFGAASDRACGLPDFRRHSPVRRGNADDLWRAYAAGEPRGRKRRAREDCRSRCLSARYTADRRPGRDHGDAAARKPHGWRSPLAARACPHHRMWQSHRPRPSCSPASSRNCSGEPAISCSRGSSVSGSLRSLRSLSWTGSRVRSIGRSE
jgi:hypothetical protein